MKTHKYLSIEEHRNWCPKISKDFESTQICEDCLIVEVLQGDYGRGSLKFKCDLSKLKTN